MFTLVKCPNIRIKVIGAEISVPSGLGLKKGDGLWSFTDYPAIVYRMISSLSG